MYLNVSGEKIWYQSDAYQNEKKILYLSHSFIHSCINEKLENLKQFLDTSAIAAQLIPAAE